MERKQTMLIAATNNRIWSTRHEEFHSKKDRHDHANENLTPIALKKQRSSTPIGVDELMESNDVLCHVDTGSIKAI